MKATVTEAGVWIPKSLLSGATEVEMHREGSTVLIVPVGEDDPVWEFGKDPVDDGVSDGSVNHDRAFGET